VFPDFKELIALLNEHKVKYLVIGGYAVAVHAQPRATKDLDILILPAPGNAKAVFKALAEFGAPLSTRTADDASPTAPRRKLTAKDFEDKETWFTFGIPPVAVDMLQEIPGVTFNAAWKNRATKIVDPDTGLTAHFISRDDLIAAKLASGRPQDLGDVDALRKAAAEDTLAAKPTKQPPLKRKTKPSS
jgi:hypothetical protein